MKTIKIIDLLNKIANRENVPKKINYKGVLREYDEEDKDYMSVNDDCACYLFFSVLKAGTGAEFLEKLTDEVEIIEEEKEIEKIDMSSPISVVHCAMKINELIDVVKG